MWVNDPVWTTDILLLYNVGSFLAMVDQWSHVVVTLDCVLIYGHILWYVPIYESGYSIMQCVLPGYSLLSMVTGALYG